MNLCSAYVRDNAIEVGGAKISVSAEILTEARNRGLSEVTIGFRPEDMQLGEGMAIAVEFVEVLGVDAYVYGTIETAHGQQNTVIRTDGRKPPKAGDTIHVNVKDGHIHAFDSNTGERLGK
jgi:multiple sugar transport system ATP-binding protein